MVKLNSSSNKKIALINSFLAPVFFSLILSILIGLIFHEYSLRTFQNRADETATLIANSIAFPLWKLDTESVDYVADATMLRDEVIFFSVRVKDLDEAENVKKTKMALKKSFEEYKNDSNFVTAQAPVMFRGHSTATVQIMLTKSDVELISVMFFWKILLLTLLCSIAGLVSLKFFKKYM